MSSSPAEARANPGRLKVVPIRAEVEVLGDAELVRSAREGQRRALGALYRRHAASAIDLAGRLLGAADEVEDIVQEAFLAAFEQLRQLRDPASFRGWLFGIIVNLIRRTLYKRGILRRLGLYTAEEPLTLEDFAAEEASPEERSELLRLDRLLRKMPAEERIAWMLRAVEGHTLREVAELTGAGLSTVKRRLARADRRVARHFEASSVREGEP